MLKGEIALLIDSIEFTSKEELLNKLRTMRTNTVRLSPKDRRIAKEMLGVAIQQVYHIDEAELMAYKKKGGKND